MFDVRRFALHRASRKLLALGGRRRRAELLGFAELSAMLSRREQPLLTATFGRHPAESSTSVRPIARPRRHDGRLRPHNRRELARRQVVGIRRPRRADDARRTDRQHAVTVPTDRNRPEVQRRGPHLLAEGAAQGAIGQWIGPLASANSTRVASTSSNSPCCVTVTLTPTSANTRRSAIFSAATRRAHRCQCRYRHTYSAPLARLQAVAIPSTSSLIQTVIQPLRSAGPPVSAAGCLARCPPPARPTRS